MKAAAVRKNKVVVAVCAARGDFDRRPMIQNYSAASPEKKRRLFGRDCVC
jgi:hypothetical protein